jgi:hypothetical protein
MAYIQRLLSLKRIRFGNFIPFAHETLIVKFAQSEVVTLLGCYAALIGSYQPTSRDSLSVPSSRMKQSKKNSWAD